MYNKHMRDYARDRACEKPIEYTWNRDLNKERGQELSISMGPKPTLEKPDFS